jgi:murein DD-endopeptidase MepM/ murein hydrolase activator NlpD
MGWLNDASSAIGWLTAQASAGGQTPQQIQQSFQQLGISSEDFLSWFGYMQTTGSVADSADTPAPGSVFTPAGMQALGQWLTSPFSGSSPGQPAKAAAPQQQAGAAGNIQIPAGVNQTGFLATIQAAQATGVPVALALALVAQETGGGFDPNSLGDYVDGKPTSFGLAQLHQGGELDSSGLDSTTALSNPVANVTVALRQVQQVMQQHPDWSYGQIAAAAQRPGDPSGYASSVNSWVDQVQTGKGPLGFAQPLMTGSLQQRQGTPGGTNQVPLPFSSSYFQNISQSFGQNGEQGTDFAMPEHQMIITPVGGTIQTRDDGNRNWGRAVYVKMPNGWTFFVGHMFDFAVQDGQTVAPGQQLGTSGGGPDAPSPGASTGAHIEIRFIDPSGQNQDPMGFLQPLYNPTGSATTASNLFSNWMGGMFQGAAQVQPSENQQNIITTPDQRIVDANSPLGQWYQAVDSVWVSVFGQHAPLQSAIDFRNGGVQTHQGITDAVNGLPSNIAPGVSIGSFNSLEQSVNAASNSAFGRPVPQSLVTQFFAQGITSASDVKLWFDTHSSSDIPPAQFQAVFDAANPYTQAVWSDVPHPTDVASMWQQAGGTPPPSRDPSSAGPGPLTGAY